MLCGIGLCIKYVLRESLLPTLSFSFIVIAVLQQWLGHLQRRVVFTQSEPSHMLHLSSWLWHDGVNVWAHDPVTLYDDTRRARHSFDQVTLQRYSTISRPGLCAHRGKQERWGQTCLVTWPMTAKSSCLYARAFHPWSFKLLLLCSSWKAWLHRVDR